MYKVADIKNCYNICLVDYEEERKKANILCDALIEKGVTEINQSAVNQLKFTVEYFAVDEDWDDKTIEENVAYILDAMVEGK